MLLPSPLKTGTKIICTLLIIQLSLSDTDMMENSISRTDESIVTFKYKLEWKIQI